MSTPLAEEDCQLLLSALRKISFFSALPSRSIDRVIEQFTKQKFGRGKKVIRQGKPGFALYVIKSGSCAVYRRQGWFSRKRVAVLQPGDFFGEMSLLFDAPVSATVQTLEPVEIFRVFRNTFDHVMQDAPDAQTKIRAIAEERRKANETTARE